MLSGADSQLRVIYMSTASGMPITRSVRETSEYVSTRTCLQVKNTQPNTCGTSTGEYLLLYNTAEYYTVSNLSDRQTQGRWPFTSLQLHRATSDCMPHLLRGPVPDPRFLSLASQPARAPFQLRPSPYSLNMTLRETEGFVFLAAPD